MNPYISHTPAETEEIFKVVGIKKFDDLFIDIRPELRPKSFHLPEGRSEFEVVEAVRQLAAKNDTGLKLFIGGGYYDHYIPSAVNALISRGEFFTAYTPYQPECSQGTLQALYEYQSAICTLTGMEIANASLYDGGTALYEAVLMAVRITGRQKIVMDGGVSPIYRKLLRSYAANLDIQLEEISAAHGQSDRREIERSLDKKTAGIVLQNPNFFGAIDDHSDIIQKAHALGLLAIESVYPLSLGLLKTPGEMGADIVTGEGQCLGLPLNFGGPYLGFMSTRKEYIRKMPGRIVGQTVDGKGQRCFVNTLQAREQHIRREKATSNICTNVSLCAVQSLIYLSLLGKKGLKELAQLNLNKAGFTRQLLSKIKGVEVKSSAPTFNEFTVCLPQNAEDVVAEMIPRGFVAGFPLGRYYKGMDNYLVVAVTEKRTKEEIVDFAENLDRVLNG
ncbi:MAG: aminomethyl-transferring glycine dehydrogenase subunit GcvPA [Candidatus Omnitrophota bacterium]